MSLAQTITFLFICVFEQPGELGDAGGLSRAVDAGDQDDGRAGGSEMEARDRPFGQLAEHLLADDALGLLGVADLPQPPAVADLADDPLDVFHAHVRLEELLFQLGEERVVDLPAGNEQRADVGVEHRRRLAQRPFELVESLGEETHTIKDRTSGVRMKVKGKVGEGSDEGSGKAPAVGRRNVRWSTRRRVAAAVPGAKPEDENEIVYPNI